MPQSCCLWEVQRPLALLDSYESSGIDNKFRNIDIDTSDQVHQIGGRFDEALSNSLYIHGAHEEALRRIEHYSMTSMHSSAHSIRSMNSIHTELSRLEAMITSASIRHASETETGNSHIRRGSTSTERGVSAAEGGNRDSNLSVSSPLPEHRGESSIARDSGIELAPQNNSFDETGKSLDRSSQSQRTGEIGVERCVQPDYQISSADYRSFLDASDDINNLTMESPADGGNKSSFLYAKFSQKSERRLHESPALEIDRGAIHGILRQTLASAYPPEIVDYVSIRQVTALCEDHIDLLDKRPSVEMSAIGKMKEIGYVDHGTAHSSMINLRSQLIELRNAITISKEKCIQAGYSLSELDKLLFRPGSGSYAPGDRQPRIPKSDSGDDSSSVYSEDFHSPAE